MSVATLGVVQNYTGDGGTSLFPYPNYVLEPQDLIVMVAVNGVATSYAFNAQPGFTFAGIQDGYGAYPTGGNVQMVDANGNAAAPVGASSVMITRFTPRTQPTSWIDGGAFPASAIEHAFDRLILIAQENQNGLSGLLGYAPAPPSSGNYVVGQWFINSNQAAGQPFGWMCTAASVGGNGGTWNVITDLGL